MPDQNLPPLVLRFQEGFNNSLDPRKNSENAEGEIFLLFVKSEKIKKIEVEKFLHNEKKEKPNSNFIQWTEKALKELT